MSDNCNDNRDSLKLVRDGTSQAQRPFQALDPAYAPVNERTVAHGMVFARQYSAFLKYFNNQNLSSGSWQTFFSDDLSLQLAIAAIQNVDNYRQEVKRYFDFLNDLSNDVPAKEAECKERLGYLFSCVASLAVRLDELNESLPADNRLKGALQNVIKNQLAPHFRQFWAYYKHDFSLLPANRLIANLPATINLSTTPTTLGIVGSPALPIVTVSGRTFSTDWIPANAVETDWTTFYNNIAAENGYGTGGSVFTRINRLSTHNLFTSIFDQFLRAYARTVAEAKAALDDSLTQYDGHAPHYALFLAFLRLHEYARAEANTLTGRHLDFYYKKVLRLREKPAAPGHAHLLVELAKHASNYEIPAGEKFTAGKDDLGRDVFFKNDRNFVANKAKVTALKTVYRHSTESSEDKVVKTNPAGRIFASPVANSDDGLGAELTSTDQSWHPFFNKIYTDGLLSEIRMPMAELGFAVTSHYLFLAGGIRTVALNFTGLSLSTEEISHIKCFFSTEKGWEEWSLDASNTANTFTGTLLQVVLKGDFPPVVPYSSKVHGYGFDTNLPMMLVKLKQDSASEFLYKSLQDAVITQITLGVKVENLKSLAVSNDFGPVDTSKPFQPFGAQPLANSSLIVGSKEIFQKNLISASVKLTWQNTPAPYTNGVPKVPTIQVSQLTEGKWVAPTGSTSFGTTDNTITVTSEAQHTAKDAPDLTENEQYTTAARRGFVRLSLSADFGQAAHQKALLVYIKNLTSSTTDPAPPPPLGPFASAISFDYVAAQEIDLNASDIPTFTDRKAKFFHLGPFGHAERHHLLKDGSPDEKVHLLPQFDFQNDGAAELYIGIANLRPPQNLSLLFQVADGTANPLAKKPKPHIHWSYLNRNEWVPFDKNDVGDNTGELTRSGIVTLAMPRAASDNNTLLPSGSHWIRLAVGSGNDAVCRLLRVAAQALQATFADAGNDPAFPAKTLPAGTIAGLDQPDAAVKGIEQPFQTFGGRGQENLADFYTRVSERLRHRDRAVALWDYERLILEAFPQLYRAKCLPHTQYQPAKAAEPAKYRELAPGHVTIITIPNQQQHNLHDPLRPYTSLGLLLEIEAFLQQRLTCFATLHVRNPEFEPVWTEFRVRLMPGYDETFYLKKLRQEITRFLSPWAYSDGSSPSFGGKVFKSVLINFVEERPYVDYVTDFILRHRFFSEKDGREMDSNDLNEVAPSKAVSILVSVPESGHDIQPITEAAAETAREKCLCEA